MRKALQDIDFLTRQLRGLRDVASALADRRVRLIKTFRRQVVTTMYQGEPSFRDAFSDEEAVDYLCELFENGFLDPLPAGLPSVVLSSFFLSRCLYSNPLFLSLFLTP